MDAVKERLSERSEMTKYGQEILCLLKSDQSSRDACAKLELMESKLAKGKENTAATIQTLEHKRLETERATVAEYRTLMEPASSTGEAASDQPSIKAVKEEIHRIHDQMKEMERDLKKLEVEKKIMAFHKKQYKLQKAIAKVQFDTSSSEEHIKGYLQGPDGRYETFEFDFTKDCPCAAADFMWDKVSD